VPLAPTPPRAGPPRSQSFFHFFVENLFDHLPHPFPDRCFQSLSPENGLAFYPFRGTFAHGVFLLKAIERKT